MGGVGEMDNWVVREWSGRAWAVRSVERSIGVARHGLRLCPRPVGSALVELTVLCLLLRLMLLGRGGHW